MRDCWLDRVLHRRLSRPLSRTAARVGIAPNLVTLASFAAGLSGAWCLAGGTRRGALLGLVLYLISVVLDHADGEVARLTKTESRLGHRLDLLSDATVHGALVMAMGIAAERHGGVGATWLAVVAATGVAASAALAGERPTWAPVTTAPGWVVRLLGGLGNRHGFYVSLLAFAASLALWPARLPALLVVMAVGSQCYWTACASVWLRHRARTRREARMDGLSVLPAPSRAVAAAAPELRTSTASPASRAARLGLAAVISAALVPGAASVTPGAAQARYETPPVLRAADLAGPALLRGARFRVDDQVPADGLLQKFTIRSDFGDLVAEGPGMLEMRVGEVGALDALEQASKSEVFANALKDSAARMGESLKTPVTNPVETVKGLPEGVGRFFERVGRGVKTGTERVGDYVGQGVVAGAARPGGPPSLDQKAAPSSP